jgi:hypothetical protein
LPPFSCGKFARENPAIVTGYALALAVTIAFLGFALRSGKSPGMGPGGIPDATSNMPPPGWDDTSLDHWTNH